MCVPSEVFGAGFDDVVTTDPTTFLPASSSYSWSRVSGSVLTVNTPGGQTTTFSKVMSPGESTSAIYRCTTPNGVATVAVQLDRFA